MTEPTTIDASSEQVTAIALEARSIPVPRSISPAAQAALQAPRPNRQWPPVDDHDGWRAAVADMDALLLSVYSDLVAGFEATVVKTKVEDVPVFVITPADTDPESSARVFLDIHGGGFVFGADECCRVLGLKAASRAGVETWAVDYRMPPDHPYPAALDDCLAVYRALLGEHRPEDIIVGGGSAGGNLAAAVILRARDLGLPMPAAAVLISPGVDLTHSGDTFHTLAGIDPMPPSIVEKFALLFANGHDFTDPYLSPLFGDFTKGFPPTFLQTGTRDLFLSNTVRMHRALRSAGVEAELHVFEAMPHAGFGGAPEDAELDAEIRSFIDNHWGRGG